MPSQIYVPFRAPPPLAAERERGRHGAYLLPPGLMPWATHIPPRWGSNLIQNSRFLVTRTSLQQMGIKSTKRLISICHLYDKNMIIKCFRGILWVNSIVLMGKIEGGYDVFLIFFQKNIKKMLTTLMKYI